MFSRSSLSYSSIVFLSLSLSIPILYILQFRHHKISVDISIRSSNRIQKAKIVNCTYPHNNNDTICKCTISTIHTASDKWQQLYKWTHTQKKRTTKQWGYTKFTHSFFAMRFCSIFPFFSFINENRTHNTKSAHSFCSFAKQQLIHKRQLVYGTWDSYDRCTQLYITFCTSCWRVFFLSFILFVLFGSWGGSSCYMNSSEMKMALQCLLFARLLNRTWFTLNDRHVSDFIHIFSYQ